MAVLSDVDISLGSVLSEDFTGIPAVSIVDSCFNAELVRGGVGEV